MHTSFAFGTGYVQYVFRSLLAVDCGAFGAKLRASNIHHDGVGGHVFSGQSLSSRGIVEIFHGLLVYSNLTTQMWARKTYIHGVMFVTVDNFFYMGGKDSEAIYGLNRKGEEWMDSISPFSSHAIR